MSHVSRDLKIGLRTLSFWVSRARKGELAGTFTHSPHMPVVIRTLDQIAREKQRGAIFITFQKEVERLPGYPDCMDYRIFDYERDQKRILFVKWLYENHINFEECFGCGSVRSWRHKGQIYLDVPYDESNSQYQLLRQYIENLDGSLKDPEVAWCFLKLETAIQYEYYDYWGDFS